MTNSKKLKALFHSTFTLLGICILFCVLFCVFPTQTWMIPIMVLTLLGFPTCYIFYKMKKYDWDKDE